MRKLLLLLMSLMLSVVLMGCDESGDNESNDNEEAEAEDEEEVLGVGDTAEVGDIEFTLENVETTDERNEMADEDPNKVVKIEYELENNSDEEIPIGGDLQVYDGTDSQVDSYPLDNTMGSLKSGKKEQGVEHFGIEEGPIEIYFQPMMSLDDEAIFEAEIE